MKILGKDLKIGDLVSVWWYPDGAYIYKFEKYSSPLGDLFFPDGARIGHFVCKRGSTSMAVDNCDYFDVFNELEKLNG